VSSSLPAGTLTHYGNKAIFYHQLLAFFYYTSGFTTGVLILDNSPPEKAFHRKQRILARHQLFLRNFHIFHLQKEDNYEEV
jgi:hypothetical protein